MSLSYNPFARPARTTHVLSVCAGSLAALAFVIVIPLPLAAQQVIDLSSSLPPARTFTVTESCVVAGAATRERPNGLYGVAGGRVSSDGGVLVLNSGSNEVLRFARDGAFVGAIGRTGGGPGEFSAIEGRGVEAIELVRYRGDSVAIFDAPARRISILDAQGRFGRMVDLRDRPTAARGRLGGVTSAGDFVILVPGIAGRGRTVSVGTNAYRDSLRIVSLSPDGSPQWESPPLAGGMLDVQVLAINSGGGSRMSIQARPGSSVTVIRMGVVTVAADLVHHYVESVNELHSFNVAGRLVRRLILPRMPTPPQQQPNQPIRRQTLTISSDLQNRVWLEVPRSHTDRVRDWWVIAESGQVVAKASLPADLGFLDIGVDRARRSPNPS